MLPITEYSPIFIQAHQTYRARLSWGSIYSIMRGLALVAGLWTSVLFRCHPDEMFSWATVVVMFSAAKYVHQRNQRKILDDLTHI